MTFEGIIATPFGYLLDWLYRLTSNYGIAVILFAICVQAVMVPLGMINRKNSEKKRRLKPLSDKIKLQYKDDPNKQIEALDELYKKEKYNIAGTFILAILPIFILIPLFQVVAQPITYLFHERPETAAAIVKAIQEEAPELFVSGYHQITAISHISEYADIVKQAVPEVSARTLEGLDLTLLGLNLGAVPGIHVIGKGTWGWDWAHVGVILIPIVYMGRRIYRLFEKIARSLICYNKAKKRAAAENLLAPKMPRPPLLDLFFLFLSLTVMFAVPITMTLYWLIGGLADSALTKLTTKCNSANSSLPETAVPADASQAEEAKTAAKE